MDDSSNNGAETDVKIQLKHMLDLAFGTPQLRNANFSILQNFLGILLKKLQCEQEIITVGGVQGEYIKQVIEDAKPIKLKKDPTMAITDGVDSINSEIMCKDSEDKIFKRVPKLYMPFSFWELYNQPCEDVYIHCNSDNYIACQLLHNDDFLHKLMRRIAFPLVERIFEIEAKIERLSDMLEEFIKAIREQFDKLVLIEAIIDELEKVKTRINDNYLKFIGALEEIQDMLDAKLDKIHLPALKKYLKDRFDDIEKKIKALQEEKNCTKAAGIIVDDVTCISCGNRNICAPKYQIPVGTLPAMNSCGDKYKPKCGCYISKPSTKPTLMQRVDKLDAEEIKNRIEISAILNRIKPDDTFLVTGIDGNLYRGDASPKKESC